MVSKSALIATMAAYLFQFPGVTVATAADYTVCTALVSAGLVSQVYYPGETNYTQREASYWSTDAPQTPKCIIQPRDTAEVSTVMSILSVTEGNFAVRSGGHSHWAGGSDIGDGVTVDLGLLNGVNYNSATGLAELEPGSNWYEVYNALETYGVSATGGRDAGVGIGGFLTGGGNSYYAGKMGLGCDTIVNAEVVLANGTIVNANSTSNPDLLKALKGGSGNFGIVTRFDVETFPWVELWGGLLVSNRTYGDQAITALANFGNNNTANPQDAYIINFTYNPASFTEVVISSIIVDVDGAVNPTAFAEAVAIPTIATNLETQSMANIAETYVLAAGYRNTWFSLTFQNNEALMRKAASLNDELVAKLLTLLPADVFTIQSLFQPIPTYFAGLADRNGGNVLGLENYEDNAVLWLLTGGFNTAEQESIAYPHLLAYSEDLKSYANNTGTLAPWRYINYVNPTQDPLASYGAENIAFMKEVSLKYDPDQVFQTKCPAGFKLSAM